jgi:HSP20 family molecular chaperone IbpA
MLPGLQVRDKLIKELGLFEKAETEVVRVREDENRLEATIDTAQFRPEELAVTVDQEQGKIIVEGSHEEKSEDRTKTSKKHFLRR